MAGRSHFVLRGAPDLVCKCCAIKVVERVMSVPHRAFNTGRVRRLRVNLANQFLVVAGYQRVSVRSSLW